MSNPEMQPGDIDIDITGLDEAEVLVELWKGTRPLGLGILQAGLPPVTVEEARGWFEEAKRLNQPVRFDYVKGRPIKVTFHGNILREPWLYDRDAGKGAAQHIIDEMRVRRKPA